MAAYTICSLNAGTNLTVTTTAKTSLVITAATGATTLRRVWLMEWEVGAFDVPNSTDCPITWDISKVTAAGTSTALTPLPNDVGGGDAAALGTYGSNATIEPTVTANTQVWALPLNQRASYRVQMRDEWSALVVPATNAAGFAARSRSPNYTSTVSWRALVRE